MQQDRKRPGPTVAGIGGSGIMPREGRYMCAIPSLCLGANVLHGIQLPCLYQQENRTSDQSVTEMAVFFSCFCESLLIFRKKYSDDNQLIVVDV